MELAGVGAGVGMDDGVGGGGSDVEGGALVTCWRRYAGIGDVFGNV